MIECTTNINRKAFVRAKARKPRIERLANNQFRVAGSSGPYLITFSRRRRAFFATCINEDTETSCPRNERGLWCYHVAWSLMQMVEQQAATEQPKKRGVA